MRGCSCFKIENQENTIGSPLNLIKHKVNHKSYLKQVFGV